MDRARRAAFAGMVAAGTMAGALLGLHAGARRGGESHEATPPGRAPAEVASGSSWGQHAPRPPHPAELGEPEPELELTAPEAIPSDPGAEPAERELAAGASSRPLRESPATDTAPHARLPEVSAQSHVDPLAVLEGWVTIDDRVWIGPFVSVRADLGQPISIGPDAALEDGVVVRGLRATSDGQLISPSQVHVGGRGYAVYVGDRVAIGAQAQLLGPLWIEGDTWVGGQALIADARVERGAVIEPGAVVIGVRVPRECYVPAGAVVDRQEVADRLPEITAAYRYRHRTQALLSASAGLLRAHLSAEAEPTPLAEPGP